MTAKSNNKNTVYGQTSTTADVAFYTKSNLTPLTLQQVTTINSGPRELSRCSD